jgi:NAD(P)-dependent dehydrogenase (short-subunit alcohol dehydrogenase family)
MTDVIEERTASRSGQPRLAGKVAIVTGAGSKGTGVGTGKGIAVRFAQEGARVVLVDRHEDRAAVTREWIEREGGEAVTVITDLTDPTANERIVDAAVSRFGRLDHVVSNAAVYAKAPFLEMPKEELEEGLAVNLVAPALLSQAAIPHIIEAGGGSITYISSILAMRGGGNVPYAASKAGLMGLTTCLANTFGTDGIRFNTIAPGMVDTPVRQEQISRAGLDPSKIGGSKATSLGIQGDAWDVANTALFLASDEGRYLTGLLVPVDGGATTRMGSG